MSECPMAIHAQAAAWVREFVSDWRSDMDACTSTADAAPRVTDNTGTLDPSLTQLHERLSDAEWDGAFLAGQIDGYWNGMFHGGVLGLAAGALIVALAFRAGYALL